MSKYTNFTCNYIPKYVLPPETLPWYEKDFSYSVDPGKCEKFLKDTDGHLQKTYHTID